MATILDYSELNLQDALDMAVLIEREAEKRYLIFAEQLGKRYPDDAADFFTAMARNERKHGDELAEKRRRLFGDNPSRVTEIMMEPDVEAPEFEKAVRLMSPLQALEVAMEAESKAYDFYDRILFMDEFQHDIQSSQVRELIRELRDEEAEHKRLLNKLIDRYADSQEPDFALVLDELPAL